MAEMAAPELGSQAELPGAFQQHRLQGSIPEGVSALGTLVGQRVQILGRCQLHGFQVEFGGSPAHHHGQVIRRAGRGAQAFHLGDQEIHQGSGVEHGLGLLVQIGLVGRAAPLGQHQEAVDIAPGGVDLDLGRQVAAGILLRVHGQRCILGVAQIILGIGIIDAPGQGSLIIGTGPNLLALFAHDDGRARILAHGELEIGGDHRVFQHFQGDEAVIGRTLGILEDGGQLFQMGGSVEVGHLFEGGPGQQGQALGIDLEHAAAFKIRAAHVLIGQLAVWGVVRAQGKHGLVFMVGHCYGSLEMG